MQTFKRKISNFKTLFSVPKKGSGGLSRASSVPVNLDDLGLEDSPEEWNSINRRISKRKKSVSMDDDSCVRSRPLSECLHLSLDIPSSLQSTRKVSNQSLPASWTHDTIHTLLHSPASRRLSRQEYFNEEDEWLTTSSSSIDNDIRHVTCAIERAVPSVNIERASPLLRKDLNGNLLEDPTKSRDDSSLEPYKANTDSCRQNMKLAKRNSLPLPDRATFLDSKSIPPEIDEPIIVPIIADEVKNSSSQSESDPPKGLSRLKTKSFLRQKRRSIHDRKRRLTSECYDMFFHTSFALNTQQLKLLLEYEVQNFLTDKKYCEKLVTKWCKEITNKIRDKIKKAISDQNYKIVVSAHIGSKLFSNHDTIHVAIRNACDPLKDRFITVALEGEDLFVWVSLFLLEF